MAIHQRVMAFLVGSPGDLINLVAISSVFSYPMIGGRRAYLSKILSYQSDRDVRGRDGLTITNCIPYSEYKGPIDTLIVLSGENEFTAPSEDVIRWIRNRAPHVRRIVSVCVGAFVLAPTGLLDGKRVTTHWHHAAKLAQQYPRLKVDKDRIFIKDGKIYSTAGVTVGIDMALSIVEEDIGHSAVAAIAHTLVLYIRRPGNEPQFSNLLAQQANVSGTPMRDLPAWVKSHLTQKLDVNTLARVVAMSPRTFARQFEVHFRTTPARWVQSLRVEAACVHLSTGQAPLKAISKATGFRDEQALRRAFVQQLVMTPKEYRERFGVLRFSGSHPIGADHPTVGSTAKSA
ncbi:MAG: helix-turn-helix domain-containing protein [Candidatus Eremiobacteraeota bacterium]|nr:helix-turn-helix domain-containing protein [Candidatus Eremiobacteraeota bacterium]MBV8572641.1 helix-turn-helix domain-containing protein [Acidobacteriaceae bacterium]